MPQILFGHLGSRSRDKKDVSADADVVSVRAITGTTLVVCFVRITIRIVIMIKGTVAVIVVAVRMRVFIRVNAGLPRIGGVTRAQCHPTATASNVLYGEGNEHHE